MISLILCSVRKDAVNAITYYEDIFKQVNPDLFFLKMYTNIDIISDSIAIYGSVIMRQREV